jgi:hypothetical protein
MEQAIKKWSKTADGWTNGSYSVHREGENMDGLWSLIGPGGEYVDSYGRLKDAKLAAHCLSLGYSIANVNRAIMETPT